MLYQVTLICQIFIVHKSGTKIFILQEVTRIIQRQTKTWIQLHL